MVFLIVCLVAFAFSSVTNFAAYIDSGHPENLIISLLFVIIGAHQVVNFVLTKQLRELREDIDSRGIQ